MANMTFKANLLPNTNLGYDLGSSTQNWKIYGAIQGKAIIGTSSDTFATALQTYFNNNKADIARNSLITYHSQAYNNGTQLFGYFLNGYDNNPYGGFFAAHYNNPKYIGIQNGTFTEQAIITNTNYSTYLDLRYVKLPNPATDNAIVRFNGTDGNMQNSTATINDNGTMNIKGKLIINPSYDTTSNSFNEGIRVNQASNGWAEIYLGGTADSASGVNDTGWIIGRRGQAGNKTGAIGDLTIEEQDSNGTGLTLYKDLGGAFLYSNKAANTASLTVYNANALSSGVTGWNIDAITPNMVAGSNNVILIGHSNATKNSAYIGFHYEATNSNNNYLKLGLYAADDLMMIHGDGTVKVKTGSIWVQGGSNAGGNVNRMTLTSGMPTGLQYNSSQRGTRIFSNAIALADPYNGNSNNDSGWLRHIEESANSGTLELAVGDDGNEQIAVRQYNTSSAIAREAYLLNSSGATTFPVSVTSPYFYGALVHTATGVSYINGAKGINAAVYAKKATGAVWRPAITLQTAGGGAWQIGNYNDETLEFQYATKANIDSTTNTTSEIYMQNGDTGRVLTSGNYTTYTDGRYVKKTGDTMTGTLTNTASPGFTNSVSAGSWSYLRLHNGSNYWDIATRSDQNSGCLDFRPNGSSNIGPRIYTNGLVTINNIGETSTGTYGEAAMQIREYHYGGSQTDTWGHAPRLAWHWSGRVAAQIGLASNGYLYEAPVTGTNFYKIVIADGSTYNITATPASHTHNINDIKWPASHNLVCTGTSTEWSIDMQASATGSYWHVWSGVNSASCLQCFNDDRHSWAYKLYGAVWNDYAEYRQTKENIEPGRCIKEVGDDTLILTTQRLERGCEIVSDTFGMAIGKSQKNNTPTAASGRVLAYPYEDKEEFRKHIGWPVCSGPNGTVSIMTEEEEEKYSSRIIGTISAVPDYEEWLCGDENKPDIVKVNGRVWIRIR